MPTLYGVHVRSVEETHDYDWRDVLHEPQEHTTIFRSVDSAKELARRSYADYYYDDLGDYEAHLAKFPMPPFDHDPKLDEYRYWDEDKQISVLVYPIAVED